MRSAIRLVKHESRTAGALIGSLEVCAEGITARHCEEHFALVQMLHSDARVRLVSSKDDRKDEDPADVETVERFELGVLQAFVAFLASDRVLDTCAIDQLFHAANQ
jgi:hypothetical protein